jgi:hypothetical protein
LREPIYNDWPEAAFGPPFSFDSNNLEPVVFEAYGVLGLIAPQRKARRSLAPFGFSSDGAFFVACVGDVSIPHRSVNCVFAVRLPPWTQLFA